MSSAIPSSVLAEAEIEYAEDPCHSIYVKFRVTDDKGLLTPMGADLSKTYFVIWTTTTWTLPANVAICVGPEFEYALVKSGDEYYVMATALTESAMQAAGKTDYEILGTLKGSDLEYMKTAHPFIDRTSLVIVGDHVTLESGTGCVHTAPGHGVEDYDVCHNHYPEIPIVVPVDSHGKMTEEAGQFAGLTTEEANKAIAQHLEDTGALFALQKIIHQYPHCWRCKKPVLFRATEQWFCSVDATTGVSPVSVAGVCRFRFSTARTAASRSSRRTRCTQFPSCSAQRAPMLGTSRKRKKFCPQAQSARSAAAPPLQKSATSWTFGLIPA